MVKHLINIPDVGQKYMRCFWSDAISRDSHPYTTLAVFSISPPLSPFSSTELLSYSFIFTFRYISLFSLICLQPHIFNSFVLSLCLSLSHSITLVLSFSLLCVHFVSLPISLSGLLTACLLWQSVAWYLSSFLFAFDYGEYCLCMQI